MFYSYSSTNTNTGLQYTFHCSDIVRQLSVEDQEEYDNYFKIHADASQNLQNMNVLKGQGLYLK